MSGAGRHYPGGEGYHPFPSGTRVLGCYQDDDGDECLGAATVVCAWWEDLPGAPWARAAVACVRLQFEGNATPDAYEGPVALVVRSAWWSVTLRHDGGRVHLVAGARSAAQAIATVLAAEGAPACAVLAVEHA